MGKYTETNKIFKKYRYFKNKIYALKCIVVKSSIQKSNILTNLLLSIASVK